MSVHFKRSGGQLSHQKKGQLGLNTTTHLKRSNLKVNPLSKELLGRANSIYLKIHCPLDYHKVKSV